MFFDEGNCRAVRLLNEASHFLEASLEKLLALEQEALAELNENISNKKDSKFSENSNSVNEISKESDDGGINFNFKPITLTAISNQIESTCLCDTENCEHKSACNFKKINLSSEFAKPLPSTSENSKRKHSPSEANKNSKKSKCDKIINQSNEESSEQFFITRHQSEAKNNDQILEKVSESRISNRIKDESNIDLGGSVNFNESNNSCNDSEKPCQNPEDSSSPSTNLTIIDNFFKVQIKFKESFSYEQVEELVRAVGLDDVFDILLVKKRAELSFLSENSMKKALNLPKSAIKRLRASEILPVENNTES